ncbi:TPA: transporter, partial [Corynebacterium striatum]|nr:transporter [Corynebacterium striatum]
RVAAGVHYVHDVLSGLALGVVTVCLVVVLLHPVWVRFANSEQSRLRHEGGQA